jgi:glucokinase
MFIIAADVGGTKTHLVCADASQPAQVLYEARFECEKFDNFESLLQAFIGACGSKVTGAVSELVLALPGPVDGDRAQLTNLPWVIDKSTLSEIFGIAQIQFINDFQASAYGTHHLETDDFVTLHQGDAMIDRPGTTRLVVGAGTGLGVAWTQNINGIFNAYSSEGGHVDFAPTTDTQVELLNYLRDQYAHVSYERILSGPGIEMLYRFLTERAGIRPPAEICDAAWVNQHAPTDPLALEALMLFVEVYGAYIGNIAMLFKPDDGIYITGGIAAKMQAQMQSSRFINAYLEKGRMRKVVQTITVNLVTNERTGVIGALSRAVNNSR